MLKVVKLLILHRKYQKAVKQAKYSLDKAQQAVTSATASQLEAQDLQSLLEANVESFKATKEQVKSTAMPMPELVSI
jgi:multidrug resistance efflux pump